MRIESAVFRYHRETESRNLTLHWENRKRRDLRNNVICRDTHVVACKANERASALDESKGAAELVLRMMYHTGAGTGGWEPRMYVEGEEVKGGPTVAYTCPGTVSFMCYIIGKRSACFN